jgi:CRP-like cAMP-binding protein
MIRIRTRVDPLVELLRQLPPLRHLSDRDLDMLARTLDETQLPARAVLTREGRIAEDWHLIIDGEAEVTIAGQIIARVGPGEFVGEMALASEAPRSATVRAITPMHLLTAHKSVLGGLLERPAVTRTLLARMTDRLRAAEGAPGDFSADHD